MDQRTQNEMISILPRLRRFALGLTHDGSAADDLVQSACEKAIRNIEQWQQGTRLDSWMFRILQTTHIDQMRTQKHRTAHIEETLCTRADSIDGEASAMARLTLDHVSTAMDRLSDDQRAVVILVSVEGYAYKEAADILGIPVGTLTSRLMRARSTLMQSLDASSTGNAQNITKAMA